MQTKIAGRSACAKSFWLLFCLALTWMLARQIVYMAKTDMVAYFESMTYQEPIPSATVRTSNQTTTSKFLRNSSQTFIPTPNATKRATIKNKNSTFPRPHPHSGAKDAEGNWGYVHDPTLVNQNPPQYAIRPEERSEICQPTDISNETYKFLTETLVVREAPKDFKVFCAIYTYPGAQNMTNAAIQTWAKRCDGFMAATYISDPSRGFVHLPHAGKNAASYAGIWQKVRSMFAYMYDNFGSEYDYFHINGDDVFVIVENLKAFLYDTRPDYVGHWTPYLAMRNRETVPNDFYYAGGGPGYTMSRATLKRLVEDLLPTCFAEKDWSPEDLYTAICLWNQAGIKAAVEWDDSGAHRYNGFAPDFYQHYSWPSCPNMSKRDCKFWKQSQQLVQKHHEEHPHFDGGGIEKFVSKESVSFHLIDTPTKLRQMERLIYRRHLQQEDCGFPMKVKATAATNRIDTTATKAHAHKEEKGKHRDHQGKTIRHRVNTTSKNVTKKPNAHPHAGAKDSQGHWGYIHDPTLVNQNPPDYTILPEERSEVCHPTDISNETYKFLTETLVVREAPKDIKVFCAIYTYPGAQNMTNAAIQTWAKRCDGFMAATYISDPSRGFVHLPHAGKNAASYAGIWQKVRSMFAYMYDNFGSEYDYFHINGDDVFVIVENLKAFLYGTRPDYVGHWTPYLTMRNRETVPNDFYYAGGGPGYTMSRATLKRLVEDLLPTCFAEKDQSPEDLYTAICLWKQAGIKAAIEWDDRGAHRYNGFAPDFYQHYSWPSCPNMSKRDCKFWRKSQKTVHKHHEEHPHFDGGGIDKFVSKESVSFHLIDTPAKLRRMERLIYRRHLQQEDCGPITR